MATRAPFFLPAAIGLALLAAACGVAPSTRPEASASQGSAASTSPAGSATGGGAPSSSGGTGTSPSGAPSSTPVGAVDCVAPVVPTPPQAEGPYYRAGSPERSDITEPGMPGTRLLLVGAVVTAECEPVEGAVVDVWQADAAGVYDNAGYRLRGHVGSDAAGRFEILTVVPGEYPGRTEHIHVKVTPPDGSTLTTQLYFPGEPNASDGIFDPDLVLDIVDGPDRLVGSFTFVLPAD